MRITTSSASLDQSLEEAAGEKPGEPIRIRVQPAILRNRKGSNTPSYHAWKRLHYTLEVNDVAEGRSFREALSAFFYVSQQKGIAAVHDAIVALLSPTDPVAPTPVTVQD